MRRRAEKQIKKLFENVQQILGEGYTIRIESIPKNNGIVLTAFLIREEGNSIVPVVYIDSVLEQIDLGMIGIREAAEEVVKKFKEYYSEQYERHLSGLTNERILQNAEYRVINYEANQEQLAGMPHKRFLDLAAVYQIVLDEGEYGKVCIVADWQLLHRFSVSAEELDGVAERNTKEKGFCVQPMAEVLDEAAGIERQEKNNHNPWMLWVLSRNDKLYGASVLLYDSYFESLAQELDSDLYILPSSIHEVIALPVIQESEGSVERLRQMVREINVLEVPKEEVLGENIYRYSRKKHMLELI